MLKAGGVMNLFTRKRALPDCEWRPDAAGLTDLGVWFSIGYIRPDRWNAVVLVWFSPVGHPQCPDLFLVQRLTEYIVGDPTDRDNCAWIAQERNYLGWTVAAHTDAVLMARDFARETFANGFTIRWDGFPKRGEAR
jgi:hypothetical protein